MNQQQPVVDDPDAVAEALRGEHMQAAVTPLHDVLRGEIDASDLSYEDYALALKHVPNLAIRAGSWLIDYREPDELWHAEPGPSYGKRIYPFEVKGFMASSMIELEPVLLQEPDDG